MLFCVVAGPAFSLSAYFGPVALRVQVPTPTVVIAELMSIIVAGLLLSAGFTDYCG